MQVSTSVEGNLKLFRFEKKFIDVRDDVISLSIMLAIGVFGYFSTSGLEVIWYIFMGFNFLRFLYLNSMVTKEIALDTETFTITDAYKRVMVSYQDARIEIQNIGEVQWYNKFKQITNTDEVISDDLVGAIIGAIIFAFIRIVYNFIRPVFVILKPNPDYWHFVLVASDARIRLFHIRSSDNKGMREFVEKFTEFFDLDTYIVEEKDLFG